MTWMEGVTLPKNGARLDQMTSGFASAVESPSASAASASVGMPTRASSLGGDAAGMAAIMARFAAMMGGDMCASTKGAPGPGVGDSSRNSSSCDDGGTMPGASRADGSPGASAPAGAQAASSSAASAAAEVTFMCMMMDQMAAKKAGKAGRRRGSDHVRGEDGSDDAYGEDANGEEAKGGSGQLPLPPPATPP